MKNILYTVSLTTYNDKMADSLLGKFIGISRWKLLFEALKKESESLKKPEMTLLVFVLAFVLSCAPIFFTVLYSHNPSFIPTVAFGVCAVLAIIVRKKLGIKNNNKHSFKSALSLSHTAVALGCIPAVIVIFFFPDLLSQRHDILSDAAEQSLPIGEKPSLIFLATMCFLYASWASVTEEVLFRFLLVSVLRRWSFFKKQHLRDIFACLLSAFIFGFAHYATWGIAASIALTGLGIGFGLAYLATGERLEPVLLYHFVFDILSLAAAQ